MATSAPDPTAQPYQVSARKFRPHEFAGIIGQEHVRATLENAIKQGRVAHGYILSGQRGTGKTTIARILARCLNCVEGPTSTPCGVCSSCLEIPQNNAPDVIEIDAASNRGINEMRELRENVRYRPSRDRYKVFIIDEAHQITNEAFNALLKTLEEPPEWAVFLLCTTEAHKIPATIASRCQQFSFRSVDFTQLVNRMEWICQQEGIEADAEALAVLAQAGEGSVRDSLSALDQAIACCGNKLTGADVRGLLGMFSIESLGAVTAALEAGSTTGMLDIVHELESTGRNLQHYCRELSRYFRNLLVARITGETTRLIPAAPPEQERMRETSAKFSEEDLTRWLQITIDLYSQMQYSLQPRLHLELGLLRLVHAGRLQPIEDVIRGLSAGSAILSRAAPAARLSAPKPAAAPPPPPRPAPVAAPRPAPAAPPKPAEAPPAVPPPPAEGSLKQRLASMLQRQKKAFTADAVEHAEVIENGGTVEFLVPRQHMLSLRGPEVSQCLEALLGRPAKTKITINDSVTAAPAPEAAAARPQGSDEALKRALDHPEVQKAQELFPGSAVRSVRDLKE
ncbi:MAG: DNA polymerase III subunit gamma/tau [Candidatus Solibacter sp.]|nr:DNA polymerase III subunit gamma/tau [Candidatus Solibacter sp.]